MTVAAAAAEARCWKRSDVIVRHPGLMSGGKGMPLGMLSDVAEILRLGDDRENETRRGCY